jgi:alpha-1,2-mannosyltransferase
VAALTALVGGIAFYGDFFHGYLRRLVSYDDGVYMGAATLFGHGIVPYRDFVFLHPPGVVLLLTPFVLIGRCVGTAVANEAARLFVVLVAMAGVVLFARVVRMRPTLAMAAGLVVFTLHPDTLTANQTIYLEPLLIAACLVGTALVFDGEGFATQRWRWWVGGGAFGLACGIKLWGLCPILALVVVAVISGYRTHAARLALAGAGTFALLCAPFLVMAPTAFVHDVLVVQASRNDPGSASITSRIGNLLYLPSSLTSRPRPNALAPQVLTTPQRAIVGVTVGLAIIIVVWSVLRTRRQPLSALEWYSLASVGLVTGAFMLSGDYYSHYGAFAAVFFGLAASAAVARLMSVRETKTSLSNSRPTGMVLVVAGVVAAVVVLVGYGVHTLRTRTARWTLSSYSLAQIAVAIPPGRCVVTDDVSVLLLSGRFSVDDPGCPRVVDSFAADLALTDGHVGQFEASGAVQRAWLAWLERADVVVSDEPTLSQAAPEDGWGQEVLRYLRVHFVLVSQTGTVSIYRRVASASR